MKIPGEPIIKPRPLKGFSRPKVVYVPVDVPSGILGKWLKKKALRQKKTPYGSYFLLDDAVVLYQSIGAPLAAVGLEHAIAAGAKEILMLGFCGSLNPGISVLEIVSITKAHSDEGTSGHYIAGKKIFDSTSSLRSEIENGLIGRNLPFRQGVAVSMDALYRETETWVKDKQKKGIDVVDMEASVVFALGEYHDIPVASLMIVSDELTGRKWRNIFRYPELSARVKKYFIPFL